MRKLRSKKGFTMAELLIVAAIIVILAAVAFLSYVSYLRGITKTEYDGYARSIFVAAQNHLTMAEHEGYLGRTDFGTEEQESGKGTGVYYFVVLNGEVQESGYDAEKSVFELMLPLGSVEETIRAGSYLVRYHKDTAQVMDVFCWPTKGRFAHSYTDADYAGFLSDTTRNTLMNYKSAVIGWHGGVTAQGFTKSEELLAPSIVVTNAEKLSVTVNNPNTGGTLKLFIKGVTSGKVKDVPLTNQATQTVDLDDITTPGKSFYKQFCTGTDPLIPGEDIIVYAVAYDDANLTNVAFSSEQKTNSLYAEIGDGNNDKIPDTAYIANFRHLENLSSSISEINQDSNKAKLEIQNAVQTSDLSWTDFNRAITGSSTGKVSIYAAVAGASSDPLTTTTGDYYPVDLANKLNYDGQSHSITDVTVHSSGAAGLFGHFVEGEVKNVKLIDFEISGGNAGALIGAIDQGTGKTVSVTNVLAVNSKDKDSSFGNTGSTAKPNIKGTASAGGLIGSMNGGTITNSAAALYVNGTTAAGGLIGTAEGGTVTGSYAGGHTAGGKYDSNYNVVSEGAAGGLIGSSKADISKSYSTCSASGATAGGFIGTATAGAVSDCYCTGLVNGTNKGAFAGSLTGVTASNDSYFGIINGGLPGVGNDTGETPAYNGKSVNAFDATTESYIAFAGQSIAGQYTTTQTSNRKDALPYDGALVSYYQGKFSLKTVAQLGDNDVKDTDFVAEHYGDWPSVEIFFVNKKASP